MAIGLVLAVSAWAVSATQSTQRPPRGALATCATQSGADFSNVYNNPINLVVGPLVLVGAGGVPQFVWNSKGTEGWEKFMALVSQGHRVTVALTRRTRRGAGLAYGPLPQGETFLRDTHRVVTFIACKHGSVSTADGRPVTFWSGGVVARSPRCVPLLVWIDRHRRPRHVVIHLGVSTCG
jgi:hypothetical protein